MTKKHEVSKREPTVKEALAEFDWWMNELYLTDLGWVPAIRATIEERGRLRETLREYSDIANRLVEDEWMPIDVEDFLKRIRDFKLDGEEEAPPVQDTFHSAIEKIGRLEAFLKELKELTDKIMMATGRCDDCPLLEDVRGFKSDREKVK